LQKRVFAGLFQGWNQGSIFSGGHVHSWEQVTHDAQEQRNVIQSEFGQVHCLEGGQTHNVFIFISHESLFVAGIYQNGFDGSHSEIIMILTGQEFRREVETGDYFNR